jgi:dipeptidyl aminopeptidase/acylaminoacyl peptidase
LVWAEAGKYIGPILLEGRNKEVVWAPDGKSLLFVSDRRGSNDLWSIRVADGKPAGPPAMLREHIDSMVASAAGVDRRQHRAARRSRVAAHILLLLKGGGDDAHPTYWGQLCGRVFSELQNTEELKLNSSRLGWLVNRR